jgi:hypothetical protein
MLSTFETTMKRKRVPTNGRKGRGSWSADVADLALDRRHDGLEEVLPRDSSSPRGARARAPTSRAASSAMTTQVQTMVAFSVSDAPFP